MKRFTILFSFLALMAYVASAQIDVGTGLYEFADEADLFANTTTTTSDFTVGCEGVFKYDFDLEENVASEAGTDYSVIDGVKDKALALKANNWLKIWHGVPMNGEGTWVNEWTVVVDVRIPDVSKNYCLFEANPNARTDGWEAEWEIEDGKVGNQGEDEPLGLSSNQLESGKWYRLTYAAQLGTEIKFYVDGELWHVSDAVPAQDGKAAPYTADNHAENAAFRVGGNSIDGADYDIDIDLVAIFDVTLSQSEVADLGKADEGSTGIKDMLGKHSQLKIYPNPAKNLLNIKVKENAVNFELMNSIGQVVEQRIINGETSINVNHLQRGIYFARITTIDGENVLRKVILQ